MLFVLLLPLVGIAMGVTMHYIDQYQFNKVYEAADARAEGYQLWFGSEE
jgi:hypothetical protein